ncbi:MAG: hypothetical protein GWN62_05875 [Aliifodinibius sp.]|nr:hypothetical protein [Fodinibius sp.]
MEDEELFNERYSAARSPLDEQLIQKYCTGLEDKIRFAKSRQEAHEITQDACREFERQCDSEIIPQFLIRHVNNLFEKYWGDE